MWHRRRDRFAGGFSFKSAGLGALLVVLLDLLVLSAPAFASGIGSALPIGATPEVGGDAAQPSSSAAQPAVASVTNAAAQAVEKTTAPVTEAGSKDVRTATAPTSSAVTQSGGKAATSPVLNAATQTVRKTAAPVLDTAAQTIRQTAAPVIETARQSVGKAAAPILKTAAPVHKTAAPVLKTAAPVLGAEQTLVKAAAPVLRTTTHIISGVAAPTGAVTTSSTVAKVLQGVDGATALVSKVASQEIGQVTASTDSTVTQVVSPSIVGAVQLTAPAPLPALPTADRPLSKPPVTATQNPSNAPFSVATGTTSSTTTPPSSSVLPSSLMPTRPVPQGISASAVEHLPQSSASTPPVQLAKAGTAVGSLAPFAAWPAGEAGRRAGTPGASGIPPAPSPIPGGSSGAMASAAGGAFSIFLTLAGLLLIGGLAAMRLLRLASEPWHLAPFVLIPERPG